MRHLVLSVIRSAGFLVWVAGVLAASAGAMYLVHRLPWNHTVLVVIDTVIAALTGSALAPGWNNKPALDQDVVRRLRSRATHPRGD